MINYHFEGSQIWAIPPQCSQSTEVGLLRCNIIGKMAIVKIWLRNDGYLVESEQIIYLGFFITQLTSVVYTHCVNLQYLQHFNRRPIQYVIFDWFEWNGSVFTICVPIMFFNFFNFFSYINVIRSDVIILKVELIIWLSKKKKHNGVVHTIKSSFNWFQHY